MSQEAARDAASHPLLEGVDVDEGDTICFEADGDRETADVEVLKEHVDELGGGFVTLLAKSGPSLWELAADLDPRDGWSDMTADKRFYHEAETEIEEAGVVEDLFVVDGVAPEDLQAGDDLTYLDGNSYRVVVTPVEREYDDRALCYQLDGGSNTCTKLEPGEVVEHYPQH